MQSRIPGACERRCPASIPLLTKASRGERRQGCVMTGERDREEAGEGTGSD